jgi:LysR family transcriptional activator of nhaA
MDRLNYHHLLYFFTVAREGSVAEASARLGLKQPTVSAQIHALEKKLGCKLLERSGRGLEVTPAGKTVLQYAASIFTLGGELLSALDGHSLADHSIEGCAKATQALAFGVTSSLPPVLVAILLHAIFELKPQPLLTVAEDAAEALAAQLASRSLQFAFSDVHLGKLKLMNGAVDTLHCRLLLQSSVEVFAPPALARKLRKNFPSLLADAPVLLPSAGALQDEVERWLVRHKQHARKLPRLPHPERYAVKAGSAVFAPSLLRRSLKKSYGLLSVGNLEGARWRLFAATREKNFRHPALDAVAVAVRELQ